MELSLEVISLEFEDSNIKFELFVPIPCILRWRLAFDRTAKVLEQVGMGHLYALKSVLAYAAVTVGRKKKKEEEER